MSFIKSTGESLKHLIFGYSRSGDFERKPKLLKWRSSRFFIIATVVLGIYVDIFLYGSTVVVLPFVLESQAGVPHEEIGKWTGHSMLTYSLASLVSSPIAGFLADKAQNRREPLLFGLLFLLTGCACLWAATCISVLLLGRFLQGISAGFVWSIGLALIADTVGYNEVGQVLSHADIALCFGLASAPPISGTVLRVSGKDAVYALVMGLIVLDVFMRLFLVERSVAEKFEPSSQGFIGVIQQTPPMKQTISSESDAITNEITNATTNETTKDSSYLEYAGVLFNSWRIIGALFGTWAVAHILQATSCHIVSSANCFRISIDVLVPVFCEERYGWGPFRVGMLLLCFYGPSLLCIFTGQLADRHGGRWLAIGGFLGCIPSFIGLTTVEIFSDDDAPLVMWILMLCAGTSLSFANTPVMAEIVYALVEKQGKYPSLRRNSGGYGLAYGMFMTIFSLGSTTASAGSPPFLKLKHGWSAAMYSLAGCCLLTIIPVALWTGSKRPKGRWGMRKGSSKPLNTEQTISLEGVDHSG
ncbi:major facilitator superfamily domain-containing protein [Dactylonectria macrodidyma]|uniref:Major facilitator superfamily domain-containing protein n=1 Tax=Dactylonectria macrodidyma TaxID=307937 RepID=A0A9P9J3T4_9HYPO|nr:major facilitator superfamily domain-containing protein [Dactylonectria macrodidyma]